MGRSFGNVNISIALFLSGEVVSSGMFSRTYDTLGKLYTSNSTPTVTEPSATFTATYSYDECGKRYLKGTDSTQPNELIANCQNFLNTYTQPSNTSITRVEIVLDGKKETFNTIEQASAGIAQLLPRTEYTAQQPREYSKTQMMQYHAAEAYNLFANEAITRMYLQKLNAEQRLEPYTKELKHVCESASTIFTLSSNLMQQHQIATAQRLAPYATSLQQTLEPVTKAACSGMNFLYQHKLKVGLAFAAAVTAHQLANGECPAPRYTA